MPAPRKPEKMSIRVRIKELLFAIVIRFFLKWDSDGSDNRFVRFLTYMIIYRIFCLSRKGIINKKQKGDFFHLLAVFYYIKIFLHGFQ